MKKQTGRYYVTDLESGRKFCVEPIGKPRTNFGDSITDKCGASITEDESIIREDNGFKNIGYAQNPMDYINKILKR